MLCPPELGSSVTQALSTWAHFTLHPDPQEARNNKSWKWWVRREKWSTTQQWRESSGALGKNSVASAIFLTVTSTDHFRRQSGDVGVFSIPKTKAPQALEVHLFACSVTQHSKHLFVLHTLRQTHQTAGQIKESLTVPNGSTWKPVLRIHECVWLSQHSTRGMMPSPVL